MYNVKLFAFHSLISCQTYIILAKRVHEIQMKKRKIGRHVQNPLHVRNQDGIAELLNAG